MELIVFINKFYPQVNSNIILINYHSIQNLFTFKDIIPEVVKSNVVHTFICAQCSALYVGETTRHFYTRVSEHFELSLRTGLPTIELFLNNTSIVCIIGDTNNTIQLPIQELFLNPTFTIIF